MKSKKILISLGLVSIPILLLSVLLWALPAGATHTIATAGTLTVSPTAVSPDDVNVSTADRMITITVDDINLNKPLFVGTGPNAEISDLSTGGAPSTGGERVFVKTDSLATFTISLTANPIAAGFTPLADRNDDGKIDVNDVEIVIVQGGGLVAGDVGVAAILTADRGQVTFQMFATGKLTAVAFFDVRFATAGKELTRDKSTFTQELAVPNTNLLTGESFTQTLNLVPQDTAGSDAVANSGDVTVSTGSATLGSSSLSISGAVATITLLASGNMSTGDAVGLDYLATETLAVVTGDATGDFAVALKNVVLDRNGGGVSTSDVIVTGGVTVKSIAADGNTVTFTRTTAVTGDSFSVQYLGRQALTVPNTGLFNGEAFDLELNQDWLPLQDTNGDKAVNSGDITVTVSGRTVANIPVMTDPGIGTGGLSVAVIADASNGLSEGKTISLVHSGDALALDKKIKVTYLGLKDLLTLVGDNGVTVPVRMRETGPDTHVYTATVIAVDGSAGQADALNSNLDPTKTGDGDRPHIAVNHGGAVVISYSDQSPVSTLGGRVEVEVEPPIFSQTSPASGDTVNSLDTVLTTEVVDTISGVNPATGGTKKSVDVIIFDSNQVEVDTASGDITVTDLGGGAFKIEYNLNKIPIIAAAKTAGTEIVTSITWKVETLDAAGNKGSLALQPLTIDNTKPKTAKVVVGDGWDVDTKKLVKSLRTSIRVEFDRDMDANSFQPGDFKVTVDGASFTPASIIPPPAGMPNSVFLIVPELSPAAVVTVEIVGAVADKGGNAITAEVIDTTKIADGIAPNLIVALVNSYTKADINWSTKSDEKIVGSLPTTDVFPCSGEVTTTTCAGVRVVSTPSSTIITQRQEWTFELKGLAMGRYNMKVSARDTAGNTGSAGTGTGDPTATGALTFEIDSAFPAPKSTTPATDPVATVFTKATDAPVFIITIDWTNEGTEYTGDTHADVTLTKADLDGTSVMTLASGKDNIITIAISGIGVGKHTLVYNAKDGLGNTRATDEKLNFEVVVPPPFTLNLNTGMNLISLPRDPQDTDVNAVFGGTEEISLIFTRPLPGESTARWLIAVRDPVSGKFVGDLKTVDATHAYWIKSKAPVKVNILTPPLSPDKLPPTIPVVGGQWNLVPVISLAPIGTAAGEIQEGVELDVDYFGTNWTKAFTFDKGQWIGIKSTVGTADNASATLGDAAQIGRGYWVLFTKNDNITPGIK